MGFIFNGKTSQSMGVKARLINWQAAPAPRNNLLSIPGKSGVVDFGADASEKTITLKCAIFPKPSFTELIQTLDGVAEWLAPDYETHPLILDDMPGRYWNARLSDALDCARVLSAAGEFDLKFVCPDPFAYALADESFTISAAGSHTVTRVKGNADSEPIYRLKGVIPSGADNYVSVSTNGAELRVLGALSAGETLVVDTGAVTAAVVGTGGAVIRNGLPCLQELNFPILRKGANTVTISVVGAVFNELEIEAGSRWR